jgi:hypothetical protein
MSRSTGSPMSAQEFGQTLAQIWFAPGILNLMADLADPRLGGCALTALVVANTGHTPRRGTSSRELARWALVTALGGIIGNRADDALTDAWNWLVAYISNPYTLHHISHQKFPPGGSGGHARGDHRGPDRHEEILRGLGAATGQVAVGVEEPAHLVHKIIDEILRWF